MEENKLKQIKLTATFLNTDSIIERENNLYYMPHSLISGDSGYENVVCFAYKNTLLSICNSLDGYRDIILSRWSPQDRELIIKGDVYNFRRENNNSTPLNYMLVKRDELDENGNIINSYFLGYFIERAIQKGINSVSLSLSVDDFTNVFFLMNTNVLTSLDDYSYADKIQKGLINTWVEREHIDRIFKTATDSYALKTNDDVFVNNDEKYNYRYQIKDYTYPLSFNSGNIVQFSKEEMQTIDSYLEDEFFDIEESLRNKIVSSCLCWCLVKCKNPITLPICYIQSTNTEQRWVFSESPKKGLVNSKTNIADSMQTLLIPGIVIRKEFEKFSSVLENIVFDYYCNKLYGAGQGNNFNLQSDFLVGGGSDMKPVINNIGLTYFTDNENKNALLLDLKKFTSALSNNAWADYILSATIIRDLNVPYVINYVNDRIRIRFVGGLFSTLRLTIPGGDTSSTRLIKQYSYYYKRFISNMPLPSGIWGGFIPSNLASLSDVIGGNVYNLKNVGASINRLDGSTFIIDNNADSTYSEDKLNDTSFYFVMMVSSIDDLKTSIYFKQDTLTKNYCKTNLYEPILENNPYSFYSISYVGGLEYPFDKEKYKNETSGLGSGYRVPLKYVCSNNDSLKIGIIPYYNNGGITYLATNDSFLISLTSQIPLPSDSYQSYYYQNLAQMKNQYAVNNYSHGVDLGNKLLNEAHANIVASYFGSGGNQMATLGQGVKEISSATTMGVDWAKSNKVIEMNQKAMLSGAGIKPDTIKQAGTDVYYDLSTGDFGYMLNHYSIDNLSRDSICRQLERFGYYIDKYYNLDLFSRIGYNFIKLKHFNYNRDYVDVSDSQMKSINDIMKEGITIIHNHRTLINDERNYEILLDKEV